MKHKRFDAYFQQDALSFLVRGIDLALEEDGRDLTSEALFTDNDSMKAAIMSKQSTVAAGLPIASLVFERMGEGNAVQVDLTSKEGELAAPGTELVRIKGPAGALLKAERVILNYLTHLSGIATLTRQYADLLQGTNTRLLDTRKTLPGLRYPEKYAVQVGGGYNHRKNLEEILMLKDNHIDRSGSITSSVRKLRQVYSPCPPIEVECRTLSHVAEAIDCRVERIMLDNMEEAAIRQALSQIPPSIETEVSGGIDLSTIRRIAVLGPDFISVGNLTHSAPAADLSMVYAE